MSLQSLVNRHKALVLVALLLVVALMANSVLAAAPGTQDAPLDRLQAQSDGAVTSANG